MAKITFVTFYNDFSIGVNVLSSILINHGHDVSVVFFKLPKKETISWFEDQADEFMEAVDCSGNILGGNAQINRWTNQEVSLLIGLLNKIEPDVICFSSRTTDNILAQDVLPKVRAATRAITLAGGFGPTLNPEIYAKLVDYVYIGEAENSINHLISKLEAGESIKEFPNICYLDGQNLTTNKLSDPDDLAFKVQIIPEETYYIDNNRVYPYHTRSEIVKTHTYSTFFGRGCISKCSYCSTGNWRSLYYREGFVIPARRNREIENIISELVELKKSGITFIHFRDEFMTGTYENLKQFFKLYENKVGLPFWAYLVPQQMLTHPDLIKSAVDAGWVDTETGFQSGSDFINRTIFNRRIPHKDTLKYVNLIAEYKINRQYDFIIFNPAEKKEHIQETFKLIQALPKKRAYLYMPRLYYFPGTPITHLIAQEHKTSSDFAYYYRIALLYLICFVTSKKEFDTVLNNEQLISSHQHLKEYYQTYLKKNDINFMFGTHEIPESITTHRYKRIIENNNYTDIIIWKESAYYDQMKTIFSNCNILSTIDTNNTQQAEKILKQTQSPIPLFICSPDKAGIKQKIHSECPEYPGKIYV